MTRYFLDTGVLVGLTFLHDLWHDEAERVFEADNGLYTSRAVVYEYCNSTDSNLLEDAHVDWETEAGLYGAKLSKVRAAQMNLNILLDSYDDDDLDLETLVDLFVEEVGVEGSVEPPELIDEHIRPNIGGFLEDEIEGREVTQQVARESLDALCDTILDGAEKKRETIRDRVTEGPSGEHDEDERNRRLGFVDGYVDKVILCDAEHQSERNLVEKVITSDKSHLYGNRERIRAVLGLSVLYIKDEFADHELPTDG
jgi:predicted nucleic acid-binding protein